jgi:DNA-directed RNA polymerase II subunit RPB1
LSKNEYNNSSRIIGIQFSTLSPEEIRRNSVVEITSRDTYGDNKPIIGGLFDPRMGVLESGLICPTDGLTYIETPGYFGHIELARPVFFIQHIKEITKICKCVCYKCSKLLMDKSKHAHISDYPAEDRWKYVYDQCSKIKRCGNDNIDGCGYKQPDKIKLEQMATIMAVWENMEVGEGGDKDTVTMRLTPELILKIFKRISDEDVFFMGMHPKWSRPDWMICTVLPVPPPAVRPSVKMDAQQRSEDDLTHIYSNIIKTNNDLLKKIKDNAAVNVLEGLTLVLQYYVAMVVNNKVKGSFPMAQRSGRPLQCITGRLNSKTGRIRGNLMGKRVNYSARSVITGDPNLSIVQLGIPLKIAKNLTKPVKVNARNIKFLMKLVQNGPDVYPGAKTLEKKGCSDPTSLRNVDLSTIRLEMGDVVHRHIMDGDAVLFNRQPSLHRMSMMAHIAKIMFVGDTFRMNVGDTPPYNADFDGDEMNAHFPQNIVAETELRHLAAIPYQLINPRSNSPVIGIFQDSLLGSYRFTREFMKMNPFKAMNLLMMFRDVNVADLMESMKRNDGQISNFDVLSQVLPPMSLEYKTGLYDDKKDNVKTSNNVLEIRNGKYIRGQINKGVINGGSSGIIHRIHNDFGNMDAVHFIDNFQNIITEYMKTSSYSVGISDLIANKETYTQIKIEIEKKKIEVQDIINEVHLGIFKNVTANTSIVEFESRIHNLLNKAREKTSEIAKDSLNPENRFVQIVSSGSKGSVVNITQMIACLGQQDVDGKRIPYGFDSRTLPHFSKFDDSAQARGFIENSYISGLTSHELFFHAMAGRIGLIDTAVKTSTTGYIQRRLIKGLEDLKIEYDMTVRNSRGKIIQFRYGGDGFDSAKVEGQSIPLVAQSIADIYAHYQVVGVNVEKGDEDVIHLESVYSKDTASRCKKQQEPAKKRCKELIDFMIASRNDLVVKVFKNTDEKKVNTPIGFSALIANIHGQLEINNLHVVDITPLEAFEMLDQYYDKIAKIVYSPPTELFKIMYYYYLSPKELLQKRRFHKKALTLLLETILLKYKQSVVHPGEMVGIVAGQSLGEPATQLSVLRSTRHKIVKQNKLTKQMELMSVEVGSFCDTIIEKYPQWTMDTGHVDSVETALASMEDDYFIVGVDKEEKTHWNKISHISRHSVNGNMMKVVTRSGRTVETTTSHSHLVRRNQTVEPIVGSDMKVGMRIPVAKYIENTFVQKTFSIGDMTFPLDSLWGWFFGAYLAEGCLSMKKTDLGVEREVTGSICITNISPHYIENTKKIATLFGRTCRIVETEKPILGSKKSYKATDTIFSCKPLAEFIYKTCNTGSFVKVVPGFAFLAPLEFKSGLIQGYMDGDGNFMQDKGHHQIRVCSRSEQLIKDMSLLLNYFGIIGSLRTTERHGANYYHVAMSGRYAPLYQKHIGSVLHEETLQKLVEYAKRDTAHSVSDEIDRIEGLGHIIAHCGLTLRLPGQSRNYRRWAVKEAQGKPIGRRTLQKYIHIFESHPESHAIQTELAILKQAAESSVVWDEIVSIDVYCPEPTDRVYDFTVPGNQTFMTDYGVIVHNTLNTFHLSGVSSKANVTRGVPRIEEIIRLTKKPKHPSMTIYLKDMDREDQEKAKHYATVINHTRLVDVVQSMQICFDPTDEHTNIPADEILLRQFFEFERLMLQNDNVENVNVQPKSKWIIRMVMNREMMLDKNITMDDIHFAVKNSYEGSEIHCVFSDYNMDNLVFRIRINSSVFKKTKKQMTQARSLDQSDEIYLLKNFQDALLNNIVLRGITGVDNVIPRKLSTTFVDKKDGTFALINANENAIVKKDMWILDTTGTNLLDTLALDFIEFTRTYSNDINEIFDVLGIEAARQMIYNEYYDVMAFSGVYINHHHLSVLCDRMTSTQKMTSIYRSGILNDDIGPIAKATFEVHTEVLLDAARHAQFDQMRGISANVMCGQYGYYGTNAFNVLLDLNKLTAEKELILVNHTDEIEKALGNIDDEKCSLDTIRIANDINNVKQGNMTVLCNNDDFNVGF